MRSIPVWAALLLLVGLASATSFPSSSSLINTNAYSPTGWQRALFGRNSRNFAGPGSEMDVIAENLNNDGFNEYSQLFSPYANGQQQQQQQQPQQLRQQTEVYGIVEPLIEDTPCADRPCVVNDDCCPTGVCVSTYGEGKCVYVYGRKREHCQRHADCAPGSVCMLATHEGIWRCQAEMPPATSTLLQDMFGVKAKLPLGSDCTSSSDCQVINGMCCQQQRLNHRAAPKLICGYFRDAFDCIDMAEHLGNAYQHRRN